MSLQLELPSIPIEEEARFHEWAVQQGEQVVHAAAQVSNPNNAQRNWAAWLALLSRALDITRPILAQTTDGSLGWSEYLLLLLKTLTALVHANAGHPFTAEEILRRTRLQNGAALYQLQVFSLGAAAQIAGLSQSEFIDALGRAGISVFQYTADEVMDEAAA